MDPAPRQKLPPVYVSSAELPILGAVIVVALSALGLLIWFLGRRGLSTVARTQDLWSNRSDEDPFLPRPRVVPPSTHERIQDPKYLRGILEADQKKGISDRGES